MSRQEDFEKAAEDYCEDHSHCIYFEAGAEYGYQYAQTHPNWISVEDQLPEECELVYAIREGNVEPGIYKFMAKDQWEWAPRFIACLDDITHWMPLPQPPRKED